MLIKIREKAQGFFAWVILIMICVPFALWGIQNYVDVGQETPIASVGDKDFFQRDVNRAYQQYSQQMAKLNLPEETLKQQALEKLIRDEVLLQHVQDQELVVSDATAGEFIRNLEYFQKDGKFDKKQYDLLLASQGLSSAQFVNRIRNAIIMEQFQRSVMDSSFATQSDIANFYKIQNQQRNVAFVKVPVAQLTDVPPEEEIKTYYEQHQDAYQTAEQVSIAFVELSLQQLADDVETSEQLLTAFYEEQKELYTTKERRKISHILFKFNADTEQDGAVLEKARQAKVRLETEDFASIAKQLSDDKLTAKTGGDLGLFTVGVMEAAFEEAATKLNLGEVSEPIKSSFGYHLIKVTELVPETVKPYAAAKVEVAKAFKKAQAETEFDELAETLAEMSFENPDNLTAVADALGTEVKKTSLFAKDTGEGIANEQAIRDIAFSEEVLAGNNSEPVEVSAERLVVLRMLEHNPATVKSLQDVKQQVISALLSSQAKQQALAKAAQLKTQLLAGTGLEQVAQQAGLKIKKIPLLTRSNGEVPWQLNQAIFKAAKPISADQPTHFTVALASGEQAVVSLYGVTEGAITEDKKQRELAQVNIAKALGQADFFAVIDSIRVGKDIVINTQSQ